MTSEKHTQAEQAAFDALDQSLEGTPEHISKALEAARQKAMSKAQSDEAAQQTEPGPSNIIPIYRRKAPVYWGGAIAASVTAVAISLALKQPALTTDPTSPIELASPTISPTEMGQLAVRNGVEDSANSFLVLTDMDDTEWQLIQELEFALWLTEFGDEQPTPDSSS